MGIIDVVKQRKEKFDSVFERVHDDVIVHMKKTMPVEVVEWFRCVRCSDQCVNDIGSVLTVVDGRQNLDFNLPGGELDHIMSVVDFVKILRGRTLSDEEYFKAALLGWCIKLVSLKNFFPLPDNH
jgi:farnesyl diphosphate synthase